jgi:hypothetical protein
MVHNSSNSLCSDEPLVILPIVKSAARSMEKPYSHHFLSLPLCCCHIFRQFSQQIAAKSEDALAFLWRARASLVCRLSGNFACISSFLMRPLVIRLYIIFHSHRFSLARKVNFARTPVTKRYALNGARRRLCAHSDKMKHAKRQFCARQTNYSADCKLNGHIKAGLQV